MFGGFEGGQVAFVDSAAMDEQRLARNRVRHSAVVDVLGTDVGNLGQGFLKGQGQQEGERQACCYAFCRLQWYIDTSSMKRPMTSGPTSS